MEILSNVVNEVFNMGYIILLPIMILIIGLIFKMKFGPALKAGLMVGIGLQGLNLVVGYMGTALAPAIEYYQEQGSGFTVMDIGYEMEFVMDFSVPFAPLAIVLCIGLNIILIKWTKIRVINVDIWNMGNFLTVGVIAYGLTHNVLVGLIVSMIVSVITLIYAQYISKQWQEFTGIDGVTCTTYSMSLVYILGIVINKIIDCIPGLKDLDLNIEHLREKVGVLVDPAVLGFIVGAFLALITKQSPTTIFTIGAQVSAVMILLPRIAGLLIEGLNPLGTQIRKTMQSKAGEDKELIIGMDVATGIGEPCGVTVAVLIVPIIVVCALILPGVKFFPALMLGGTIYWSVMASMVSKENVLRALLTTTVFVIFTMYMASIFAPEIGRIAAELGTGKAGEITCVGFADRLASVITLLIGRMLGLG